MKRYALISLLPSLPITLEALNVVPKNSEIGVWDNVLPVNTRIEVHSEASLSGLGHKAFTRTSDLSKLAEVERPLTEVVIDNILTELGDVAPKSTEDKVQFVEYWTRQEWRHIEAHADIDEHLAKEEDMRATTSTQESTLDLPFRYPSYGHVLYLKVGTAVEGPTCLFPNTSSGGDLLKSDQSTELVIVPAVEGRLLRFSGDILHSVPRPADLWFLPFVKGSQQMSPEETFGRSVILFNTWFDDPPQNVPLDAARSSTKNEEEVHGKVVVNGITHWDNVFTLGEEKSTSTCTDEDECKDQTLGRPAKVWLLGNERRRGFRLRTIKLKAPAVTKDLLLEKHKVSRIELTP